MFARFGFDDSHAAARSFIFFTTYTDFTRTTFRGLTISLRLHETLEEKFHRNLREGDKYEGFEYVGTGIGTDNGLPSKRTETA